MKEILDRRFSRILDAVALKSPDRVPVVLEYAGFAARVTGTPMADFLASPPLSVEVMKAAYALVAERAEADAINYGSFSPYTLPYLFGAKVRVAGVELPESGDWQVVESELMNVADYGLILEVGWPEWWKEFLAARLFEDVPPERRPGGRGMVDVKAAWGEIGVPVLTGGNVPPPLEILCGARSLARFAFDLHRRGGLVERVMNEMLPHLAGPMIEAARSAGLPVVWIGGWRSAPSLLSPEMWDRFVWPYLKSIAGELIAAGLIPLLHLDSDWTRELARFRELPAGRCIMALDGETDIFEAKRILGGRMCLMGDVPAAMLAFGEPEEVRDYCLKLIEGVGPDGFILQSGCDIPTNARLDNVQAMVAAAVEG